MRLVRLAVVAALLILPAGAGLSQGMKLEEGETVIAGNVKTGAKFTVIVRGDVSRVFYVSPEGAYLPLNKLVPLSGGQCNPGWALECHQAFSRPQRICFCGAAAAGGHAIDTTTGEIVW